MGAIETAEMVEAIVTDPIGYLNAVGTVIDHLDDLDKIIAQIPKSIKAQQDLNNPHDEGTDAYAAFQRGWYEGYVTYMVLESAVPAGKLGQTAKNSKRLQSAVDKLDRTGHLRAAAKYTSQAVDTAKAPARYAGTQATRVLAASKSYGKDVGRGLLDGAKTVGQKIKWARHADEFSPQSARLVADGGVDFRRAVYRAADSDALDSYAQLDRAIKTIDDLDGTAKIRAKQLIRDADGAGTKLIDDLGDGALDDLLDTESAPGFDDFSRWDKWRNSLATANEEIDITEIERYIDDVRMAGDLDNVENAKGLVRELTDSSDQFLGQSGEAASTVRYADEGADVAVEPGDGEFDLAVTDQDGTEFVEVKTTRAEIDFRDVNERIVEVNKKVDDAMSNPDIEVSQDNAVLEIQIRDADMSTDNIDDAIQSAIDTRQANAEAIRMNEIRVLSGQDVLVSKSVGG